VEANLCDSIRPIRLPGISSSSTNYEYLPAIASGWGRLNDGKNWYTLVLMSHKLKSRILLVFSNDNNNNNLENGKLFYKDVIFIAQSIAFMVELFVILYYEVAL